MYIYGRGPQVVPAHQKVSVPKTDLETTSISTQNMTIGPGSSKVVGTSDRMEEGRIFLDIDSSFAQAVSLLAEPVDEGEEAREPVAETSDICNPWTLPLNIVIQVVGSRGDVQPFVALGNELQRYGHRIRVATHNVFEDFVRAAGLEFYPIGGDPAELMAYMVKNPGLIPNLKNMKMSDITRKRKMIAQMLRGCWQSCIEADLRTEEPFVAHAIIANPVSFAHVHCAQALSIPLHMVFTMPWSPTRAYPHPLANIHNTTTDPNLANNLSYKLVQFLTWQGLADIINDFRHTLDLMELPLSEAPFLLETLRVPYTYCWSPALVPKPTDWGNHIDVTGFIFRQPPEYDPSPDLAAFLAAKSRPIYIGFGSIVIDDPQKFLGMILWAVKQCGVRAIISKGWSNLDAAETSQNVLFLGDCPHEWLFQHVAAVIHHGGAGTSAAGLLHGRPTAVIPFFGDQPFWGERIAAAGAGPKPIPFKDLTVGRLVEAIQFCLTPEAMTAASRLAGSIRRENGVGAAVDSFHRHLSAETLSCDLDPNTPAMYRVRLKSHETLKLSASAIDVLVNSSKVKIKEITLHCAKKIDIQNRRWDPYTAATSSSFGLTYDILKELNEVWYGPHRMRKKNRHSQREEAAQSCNDVGEIHEGAVASITASDISRAHGAGDMVGSATLSLFKMCGIFAKGLAVDVPYAIAEGFRNSPKLYGEHVPEHALVTDWKSGIIVGSKTFASGLGYGAIDLFVQPRKGWEENGATGAFVGIGKGAAGTVTKMSSGLLGIWGYPAQGLWRTLYDATHGKTRKRILAARRDFDRYRKGKEVVDEGEILERFDTIRQKRWAKDQMLALRSAQIQK